MSISGKMYCWGDKAKHVPEKPGLYMFYNKDGGLIYIGKSANLRETFTQYLETKFSKEPCKLETKYYKREFTSNQQDRAKELIEEYRQKYGRFPDCNPLPESEKEIASEWGFCFYKDINQPIHEVALNMQDLKEKIGKVPVASLEFHQKRGDFAKWIKGVIKEQQLAETVQRIDKTGEDLRTELLDSLNHSEKAQCPTCGDKILPVKTWKMAGRPSKAGERLQLTIGHYKCQSCHKTFRRVLAKEKIRVGARSKAFTGV